MRRYVVIRTPDSALPATAVPEAYPEHHIEVIPGRVWFVAGEERTSEEVCKTVGIGAKAGEDRVGVVLGIGTYSGYADGGWWEILNAWAESQR